MLHSACLPAMQAILHDLSPPMSDMNNDYLNTLTHNRNVISMKLLALMLLYVLHASFVS